MEYLTTRDDGEENDITSQSFDNYDDAYELLEEIYGDMCCSDADYEDRPYYEIVEIKDWAIWAIMDLDKILPKSAWYSLFQAEVTLILL